MRLDGKPKPVRFFPRKADVSRENRRPKRTSGGTFDESLAPSEAERAKAGRELQALRSKTRLELGKLRRIQEIRAKVFLLFFRGVLDLFVPVSLGPVVFLFGGVQEQGTFLPRSGRTSWAAMSTLQFFQGGLFMARIVCLRVLFFCVVISPRFLWDVCWVEGTSMNPAGGEARREPPRKKVGLGFCRCSK